MMTFMEFHIVRNPPIPVRPTASCRGRAHGCLEETAHSREAERRAPVQPFASHARKRRGRADGATWPDHALKARAKEIRRTAIGAASARALPIWHRCRRRAAGPCTWHKTIAAKPATSHHQTSSRPSQNRVSPARGHQHVPGAPAGCRAKDAADDFFPGDEHHGADHPRQKSACLQLTPSGAGTSRPGVTSANRCRGSRHSDRPKSEPASTIFARRSGIPPQTHCFRSLE